MKNTPMQNVVKKKKKNLDLICNFSTRKIRKNGSYPGKKKNNFCHTHIFNRNISILEMLRSIYAGICRDTRFVRKDIVFYGSNSWIWKKHTETFKHTNILQV